MCRCARVCCVPVRVRVLETVCWYMCVRLFYRIAWYTVCACMRAVGMYVTEVLTWGLLYERHSTQSCYFVRNNQALFSHSPLPKTPCLCSGDGTEALAPHHPEEGEKAKKKKGRTQARELQSPPDPSPLSRVPGPRSPETQPVRCRGVCILPSTCFQT